MAQSDTEKILERLPDYPLIKEMLTRGYTLTHPTWRINSGPNTGQQLSLYGCSMDQQRKAP